MVDYSILQKAEAIPEAASMIETFRAIGYSLETAIADIIDNSISANAKNIYINRLWRGGNSVITIKDDGEGMNSDEIIQAMRPGAQNPLSDRSETDLGRFGLGLKTASFSQCRKLSVLSKRKDQSPAFWSWDLDYVAESDKWELLQWIPEEFTEELDNVQSGTLVVWSDLDRVLPPQTTETDNSAKRKFSDALDKVKNHIAMTFHRFIEDKTIKIFWGEHEITAWNPFCPNETKTQEQPTESINGGAKMKGYVLPHKNNFSSEQTYKKAEGMNGYPAMQGFYVYRGKRLLLAGDWLGLFRKEEHYKLVRIQIDLPNKLDTEWQIDIKKSKAYPPAVCREQLESYAKSVRTIGSEVYRHRGKILKQRAGQNFQPLWLEKKKDSKWSFVVNREHLMIQDLKTLAKENPEHAIEKLLKFLEEAIPTKTIYINEAQGEETQKTPFSDVDINLIKEVLVLMYNNQIAQGKTSAQAKALLKIQEPFNNYEDLIEQL
jgi:hypothetical protein